MQNAHPVGHESLHMHKPKLELGMLCIRYTAAQFCSCCRCFAYMDANNMTAAEQYRCHNPAQLSHLPITFLLNSGDPRRDRGQAHVRPHCRVVP